MPNKVTPNFKPQRRRFFFREWRKFRDLSQERLAERVEMSTSTISQIETGKQGFTDSTLIAIAEALQCTPGDLLSRDPRKEGEIVDLLSRLDERKREEALTYLRFITRESA